MPFVLPVSSPPLAITTGAGLVAVALAAAAGFLAGRARRPKAGAPPAPAPRPAADTMPGKVVTAEQELRMVAKSARCLLWYGIVRKDEQQHLQWQLRIFDGAHDDFLPIEKLDRDSWAQAWYYRRHPDDIPRLDHIAWHAINDNRTGYRHEFRCFRTEQEIIWIEEDVRIERRGPNEWHIFGVCTDITERKQIEAELTYALNSARCLLWSSIVYEFGGFLTWNVRIANRENAQNFLPLRLEEGQTWDQAWYYSKPEEDRKRMDETSERALRTDLKGYEQEFRCTRADGETRWMYEIVRIERVKTNVWHLVGICTDITERKLAEAEREKLIGELQRALAEVKTLSGLLPICASCKRVRDDGGYWNQIESYIRTRSEVQFSHGLCPDCVAKLYPDMGEADWSRSPGPK